MDIHDPSMRELDWPKPAEPAAPASRRWRSRTALIGGTAALALAITGVGVASAATGGSSTPPASAASGTETLSTSTALQPKPAPVTVTLNEKQLTRICTLLPKASDRLTNLAQRSAGDAAVTGSIAWFKAQAVEAQSKGLTDLADQLNARADALQKRVAKIPAAQDKIKKKEAKFCVTG